MAVLKILVRYGEIALKGKNRRFFEEALRRNLKAALKGTGAEVFRLHGRFLVQVPEDNRNETLRRLGQVFGVVSVSPVQTAPLEIETIKETAANLVRAGSENWHTFKVETKRPNKSFPLTSPEINRVVGAHILRTLPFLQVDVHEPSCKLCIEIGPKEAFLYHDRHPAPGGLPVGVSGKALLLLSGGIDSPVAGWMAMKRGLALQAVHFHSPPFTGERSRQKVLDLGAVLARYGGPVKLHLIRVTEIQKELHQQAPEALRIILLRRCMIRIAAAIAAAEKLQVLVTGESLGQVASQTLPSMQIISAATSMLILRPLIGLDKHEIVSRSRAINCYEISTRPYEDCCTLFIPRHPATHPSPTRTLQAESTLPLEEWIATAVREKETSLIAPEY